MFELLASADQMRDLLVEAMTPRRFDPGEDSLRAYRLCDDCRDAATVAGRSAAVVAAGEPVAV